jgi:hypothetical protein
MGYLSEVERKQKLMDVFNGFTFEYTRDLSGDILIHAPNKYTEEDLSLAVAQLTSIFMITTYSKLNEFGGFGDINFKMVKNG